MKEILPPGTKLPATRRERRLLQRRGVRKDAWETYVDNRGAEYDYKWVAKVASFFNFAMGGFLSGFPILVKKLHYPAWACYPFFFVRRDLHVADPIPILNHERIHVVQQREMHTFISLPLIAVSAFTTPWLLGLVPFVPSIVYGLEFLRVWMRMARLKALGEYEGNLSAQIIRANTCFEAEATSRATNADYLLHRKLFAELAYTGWRIFRKYGQ